MSFGKTWKKRAVVIGSTTGGLIALVALTLGLAFSGILAHAQTANFHGKARFDTVGIGANGPDNAKYATKLINDPSAFNTIPYWGSSFAKGSTTYPYSMVGTNPARGGYTTNITTEIIPVKVVLNGTTLDGNSKVKATASSPLFLNANYAQGRTQYGDATQRAEWWHYAGSENYHVLLKYPAVESTLTVNVPSYHGTIEHTQSGATIALVDENWWYNIIVDNLLGRHTPDNVFAIFLTYNVLLYSGNTSNCCTLGYHSAWFTPNGSTYNVNTYAWGSYLDSGIYTSPVIEDINGLSHEVAEWLNDPFVSNVVPNWYVPSEPQYGCSNLLEVGDPLVGVSFTVITAGGTYHPQDIAFFSWFARQSPSIGYDGRFTYLGTFGSYSPSC